MMRLSQEMRNAFVRQVMDDVPQVDYNSMIRKAVMDEALAQMPPKVRAVWDDPDLRGWIELEQVYEGKVHVMVPTAATPKEFKLRPKAAAAIEDLAKKDKAQDEQRDKLKAQIRAVALSVTTTKALLDALPEFEKYIPKDETTALRSLPVLANVVSDFVKAGWPKGKKAVARPQRSVQ